MDEPSEDYQPDEAPPFWEFQRWLHRFLSRWRRARLIDPSDIVPPDAHPICPECALPHEQVMQYCPNCGEPVGHYKTFVYPDLIWIWGRGMWRLMGRRQVSPFVWAGMVVFALGYLDTGIVSILDHWLCCPPPAWGQGWWRFTGSAGGAAEGVVYTVVAWRVLTAARKLWGSWRSNPEATD